jgi:MerR family transcriptional regulator, light-induced transcriptional regulator
MIGRNNLTSKEVARLLGVSEASVKRWADKGLLPALKTVGGHRRFRPEDVASFRRENFAREATKHSDAENEIAISKRLSVQYSASPPDLVSDDSLFTLLVEGYKEEASARMINLYLSQYTVGQIADAVLCPAMRKVGDLWHSGELSVAEEHFATRTAHVALQALKDALVVVREERGRSAICCSMENDYHELPIHVAALVLEAQGWSVINIGMSTPFYSLAEAVETLKPGVVCIASTIIDHSDRAGREYADFSAVVKRTGSAIVLGGAGFGSEHARQKFPADLHADNFRQLEEFALTLYASDVRG